MFTGTHQLRAFVILSLIVTLPTTALAVVLSDATNDRTVIPGQPAYGLNLEGVALLGTDTPNSADIEDFLIKICTGALITDRHLLTAAHCVDEDENGLVDPVVLNFPFAAGFELPGGDVLAPIDTNAIHLPTGWPHEQHDVAVLELAEVAPPEIPRYPLYGRTEEIGKRVVITGYGATGLGSTGIDEVASELSVKRAGLNRIEDFFDDHELVIGFDFDSGDEVHNAFAIVGADSDLGFGKDEALTSDGDSGGPILIDGAIAGVTAFNTWLIESDFNDEFDQSWGEVGFASRVSSFQEFITTATRGEAVFVPEPSLHIWLPLSLLILAMRRAS